MIFETERLLIRKLSPEDIQPFYELESNPKVLQYATGEPKSFLEAKKDLENVIEKYSIANNDFWIYAVERKTDNLFLGTLALVKDGEDDEIGYRFLEKYWGNGYATEIWKGLLVYCKSIGIKKVIGYIIDKNIASTKIVQKFNFKIIERTICKDTGLPETKYELTL